MSYMQICFFTTKFAICYNESFKITVFFHLGAFTAILLALVPAIDPPGRPLGFLPPGVVPSGHCIASLLDFPVGMIFYSIFFPVLELP